MAVPLWLLLVHSGPALLVVAFVGAGLANGLVNPALHTIVQLRTPRALRTKLYSVVITGTAILGPVALVATGPALERFGVDATLVVLVGIDTALVLLFAVAGLRFRAADRALAAT
jgi:MFS family permease